MFFQQIIQYPRQSFGPATTSFGETIYVDKWIPRLQDEQAKRLVARPQYYPFSFRDEKLPPETVTLDKYYFEGILFNPRINPVVRYYHFPFYAEQRCPLLPDYLPKHTTAFTFPNKNTTSYASPSKHSTSYAYPSKHGPC